MLSDSAAAIAFRNSGNLNFYPHDEKNKLIDNESVVVYDERTSLWSQTHYLVSNWSDHFLVQNRIRVGIWDLKSFNE